MPRCVLFVYNPRSGRGLATRALLPLTRALHKHGIELTPHSLDLGIPSVEVLREHTAIIGAGGDGTINALCENASASAVPLYHFPAGTENLVARELGMSADPATIATWIDAGHTHRIDLATYQSPDTPARPVVLMVSVGPDAGVIARLTRSRRGAITRSTYIPHVLCELLSPTLPPMRIEIDGQLVADHTPGMVLIANFRHYGGGFNPASKARNDDGLLDVVLLRATSGLQWLWSMLMCRGGHSHQIPGLISWRARRVRIELPAGGAAQMDGEHLWLDAAPRVFSVTARPAALVVLTAPNAT